MIKVLEDIAAGDDGVLDTEDDIIPRHVLESLRLLINLDVLPALLDLILDFSPVRIGCTASRAMYSVCCCCASWCSLGRVGTRGNKADGPGPDPHKAPLLPSKIPAHVTMDRSSASDTDQRSMYIKLSAISPTQISVGMAAAQAKFSKLQKKGGKELTHYMLRHKVPVVRGFGGTYYAVDHHHLLHTLLRLGIGEVPVDVRMDISHLSFDEFWNRMQDLGFLWPYDNTGSPLSLMHFVRDLPADIKGMRDDPYRSLAGMVRDRGGFAKDWTPFAEFRWANYLRDKVQVQGDITEDHILKAVRLLETRGVYASP